MRRKQPQRPAPRAGTGRQAGRRRPAARCRSWSSARSRRSCSAQGRRCSAPGRGCSTPRRSRYCRSARG
eukprot:13311212-Alexandrium_andersonii.AAC.1